MITITHLLREPQLIVDRCSKPAAQLPLVRGTLLILVVGTATFGATIGSYRGGAQILYAALKLPLATLIALAAGGPAFASLAAAFDRPWGLRRTLAIVLSAGARSGLVLAALSPPLWLAIDFGLPYPALKLSATLAYALAGLSALAVLLRALGTGKGRWGAATGIMAIYLIVGAQAAWLLRPYIGDPRDENVPTFAADRKEGGLIRALRSTLNR